MFCLLYLNDILSSCRYSKFVSSKRSLQIRHTFRASSPSHPSHFATHLNSHIQYDINIKWRTSPSSPSHNVPVQYTHIFLLKCWDSAIVIMVGLQGRRPRNRGSIRSNRKIVFTFPNRADHSGGCLASNSTATGDSFPMSEANHSSHLVPRLRQSGAVVPSAYMPSWRAKAQL
jgi:hypothetical protein